MSMDILSGKFRTISLSEGPKKGSSLPYSSNEVEESKRYVGCFIPSCMVASVLVRASAGDGCLKPAPG
jgi:hypothetical protein